MLLWDVSLAFLLLPFSSNYTKNCYCANSYTIDTFAHAYYESAYSKSFILHSNILYSTAYVYDFEPGVEILTATVD